MDRLPLVIAGCALALAGCEREGGSQGAAPSSRERVNAVKAKESDRQTPEELCDVFAAPGKGSAFEAPALAAGALNTGAGWSWINVWATWCKPCIEEMPRLARWQNQLARKGIQVELLFVSADGSDEAIESFRAAHPETPKGPRLADPAALAPWLEKLGVGGATLPVHVFVASDGRVRCARASAVEDSDFEAVESLLTGK